MYAYTKKKKLLLYYLYSVLSKFGKTIRVSHVTKKDNGQVWKIVKHCSRYMVFPSDQKEGRGGGYVREGIWGSFKTQISLGRGPIAV